MMTKCFIFTLLLTLVYSTEKKEIFVRLTEYSDATCTTPVATKEDLVSGPVDINAATSQIKCEGDGATLEIKSKAGTELFKGKKSEAAKICVQQGTTATYVKIEWKGQCDGAANDATGFDANSTLDYFLNALEKKDLPTSSLTLKLTPYDKDDCSGAESKTLLPAVSKALAYAGDDPLKFIYDDSAKTLQILVKSTNKNLFLDNTGADKATTIDTCHKFKNTSAKVSWSGKHGEEYGTAGFEKDTKDFIEILNSKNDFPKAEKKLNIKLTVTEWANETCKDTDTVKGIVKKADVDTTLGTTADFTCLDGNVLLTNDGKKTKFENGKCKAKSPDAGKSSIYKWTGDCTKKSGSADDDNKLSGGAIAGIVIGSLAGVALLSFGVYWFAMRK